MVGGKDAPKINLNLHDTANACSSAGVLVGDCLATKGFYRKIASYGSGVGDHRAG